MLALLIIVVQALSAQMAEPKRPPEILALVDRARSLPPEFRADTLLRLADSQLIAGRAWKEELIEDAFWSGARAPLPYLQRADGRSDSLDTNAVLANRLEGLTLQTHSVQSMLALNAPKALHLFEEMQPLVLPNLACSTPLTPDVVAYYKIAVLVFGGAFTPKQRKDGDDFHFLRQVVASVDSPSKVPPALEMIFAMKIQTGPRRELLTLLAARLDEISRTDREYGAAETGLVSAIAAERIGPSEAAVLLSALRSYIVRHVGGRRCTDNMPRKIAQSAEGFNSLATKLDPEGYRYKPISPEEAKAVGDDGTYQLTLIGHSDQSQAVNDGLRWLTHGDRERDGKVLRWTLEERSTQDWLTHYGETANLVFDLKENAEASPEAFFCMKSDALNLLAVLAPPGPTRDKAMNEYREFLEQSYPSVQNRNLWFTMFRHMLYTARFSDNPTDKKWILDKLGRSSNPIMALYAKLETRVGPPSETYPSAHIQAAKN